MLILVEGPDGAGKSTLVQHVADVIRTHRRSDLVEVRRFGPPRAGAHPLDLYGRVLYDYRPGTGHHIICDRFHVGEWVYPAVFGRSTRADEPSWLWLESLLASRGALLVAAHASLETLADNLGRRGDDLVTVNQLRSVVDGYSAALGTSRLPRCGYRFGDPLAAAQVVEYARILEETATPLGRFITYVGPPRPSFLLLGDVRHAIGRLPGPERRRALASPAETRDLGPAFAPYPGTSGHYLLSNLPRRLVYAGLGLANACDVDDPAELRRALGEPRVAALGANALRRLRSSVAGPGPDAVFGAAPHPQSVRRFFHGHGFSYGMTILHALEHGVDSSRWRPSGSWADARS